MSERIDYLTFVSAQESDTLVSSKSKVATKSTMMTLIINVRFSPDSDLNLDFPRTYFALRPRLSCILHGFIYKSVMLTVVVKTIKLNRNIKVQLYLNTIYILHIVFLCNRMHVFHFSILYSRTKVYI